MEVVIPVREEQMNARGPARHAPSVLAEIASEWGYRCEMPSVDASAMRDGSPALAEGLIATRRLACGPNVCSSELTTLRDNARVGVVKRSVMITVNLGGSSVIYTMDDGMEVRVAAGSAVAILAADDVQLAAAYRQGERSQLLVMQCCPSDLATSDLAEQLDAFLPQTQVKALDLTDRDRRLVRELFAPAHDGLVGRLLAESCALELLARAIDKGPETASPSATQIHPRDVAKIHRLKDKLLADLDGEHRLCDLARDVGMSTSALKSKFASVTGQPVFKFLRDQRLARARIGLLQEGWTVSQAAYFVGYRHPTNFATAFRKRFGVAPTALRGTL